MRHLKEILLEKKKHITDLGEDGTYIAAKFSKKSKDLLKKLATDLEVPNILPREKMHVTIVYSKKAFTNFDIHGKLEKPWKAKVKDLEIFKTQTGKSALVLRLDCQDLTDRHNYFEKEHGATYDYPEYKIHVTLSYDVGDDWKIPKTEPSETVPELELDEEYYEALSLDWAGKDKDKKDDDKEY